MSAGYGGVESGSGSPTGDRSGERISVERVVTGVDFHESAWRGALWAMRHLAPGARHDLVHVLEAFELPSALRALGGTREERRSRARIDALARLDELSALAPGARVERHVLEGRPSAELVRFATEVGADLIVVGEQGPVRGVAALLGSTAERVLIRSPLPVLVARNAPDGPPRRLVVAIDDSEPLGRVLAWTSRLLAGEGVEATVVNVVDRILLVDELTDANASGEMERLEAEATAAMGEWLEQRIREAGLPAGRVRTRVTMGDPAYEIIAESARSEADLVVIGSRGGDVARTPVIGRIVNKVVRSAPCSVLVVAAPGG